MKTVNLLLASSDRRVNSLAEAIVRDVCFEQAMVECTRASGVDEFVRHTGSEWVDLVMVAPDSLLPSSKRRGSRLALEQAAEAIRSLKARRTTPVLALNVPPQDQLPLLEVGVDSAFAFPLDSDALKAELRRVLSLSERVDAAPASAWSLTDALRRGWQRLINPKPAEAVE